MILFLYLFGIFAGVATAWYLGALMGMLLGAPRSEIAAAAARGSVAALAAAITLFVYLINTPSAVLL